MRQYIANMKIGEVHYYNALNSRLQGNYSKLKKRWDKFQSWKKAWKDEGVDLNIKEWQNLKDLGIGLVLNDDPQYPKALQNIPFPPFGLYTLGNVQYDRPAIAIVGTRRATPQGKELARQFARKLSAAKISVISGLAMGIDEAAHEGALESQGKTVAVLGTPLSYIYPRQNQKLAENILANSGAIVSEFPLSQEYRPQNFLIRNRIISGLAEAILIIEAPERSGALATARFALEQNKDIFVIPGNINSPNYKGSNDLLKAGATPVTGPEDLLEYFGIRTESSEITSASGDAETLIGKNLKKCGWLAIDQLSEMTSLNINDLNRNLAMLTIKGIIKENNGKYSLS
jgi:DNA processing protein